MIRNYKPKTQRKVTSPRKLQVAVALVKAGWSLRQAAENKGVNRQTLFRAYQKMKNDTEDAPVLLSYKSRTVFTPEIEKNIADYCIQMAQMGYGLSVRMCRELAYEVADKNNLKMPPNWETEKVAGIDWFHGFHKRHPEISIRTPERCSVARAMAFNRTTVKTFYDKYAEVRERHPSFADGSRCYNLDETNTSTVQNTRKIISPKGTKQVHQVKGAERDVSVTSCIIINAYGSLLPPVHIFPRKKFVPDLMINCFPGALGLGNEKGYMTKGSFYQVMLHFIKCTASTKETPILLLLDNVEFHFSTKTLDLAKKHGVTVFTFPPHCTHKLQPLDVGFFGPFKTFYDNAVNSFMINNPATPSSIYRTAGFVKEALSRAATPHNITKSFEAPGIVPFNRHVFTDADFIMAEVTERPDPSEEESMPTDEGSAAEVLPVETPADSDPTAKINEENCLGNDDPHDGSSVTGESTNSSFVGPAEIRGYPKAKQSVNKQKKRRKGKCMVATDTPEKNEIMQREAQQDLKKQAEERKKRTLQKAFAKNDKDEAGTAKKKTGVIKKKSIKRVLSYESKDSKEADDVSQPYPKSFPPLVRSPAEGDYVLVVFASAKDTINFVGKILKEIDSDNDLQISYLRKKLNRDKSICFTLPSVPDINSVHINDIKVILPKPTFDTGTKRQQSLIVFDYNFSLIKLG